MNFSKAVLGIWCCFALLCESPLVAQERPQGTIDHWLIADQDGDGLADPGDTVRYTVIIPTSNISIPGISLTTYILDSLSYVSGSFDTTQGIARHLPDQSDPRFVIDIGTLTSGIDVIVRYEATIKKPIGYQEVPKPCSGGFIKFPDGYSTELNALSGKDPSFGSCVITADLDEDRVLDSEDVCLNVPHASPRLDQLIPAGSELNSALPVAASNTINVSRRGKITGLSLGILVAHSWVGDLVIKLTHLPSNQTFIVMDRPGLNSSNPNIPFGCSGNDIQISDVVSSPDYPIEDACAGHAPTIRGTLSPVQSLLPLLNQEMSGDWMLTVEDHFPQEDGGALIQWCIKPKSETSLSFSFEGAAQSISGNRFTQRLTIKNAGASDLVDLYPRVLFPFGLHPISAIIRGNTRVDLSHSPKNQFTEFRQPIGGLPQNSALTIDFEVEPERTHPYRELVVTTPSSLAGTIQSTQADFGAPIPQTGVSGGLIKADFSYGSTCDLFNSAELNGRVALLPPNICPTTNMSAQVAAAGAIAAIATSGILDDIGQIQSALTTSEPISIAIPVVSLITPQFQAFLAETASIQITLRNAPTTPEWNVTSAAEIFSDSNTPSFTGLDSVAIRNLLIPQLTTTKIIADSDGDGIIDTQDRCSTDALKTIPGVCGCGTADLDSDKDGRVDCVDSCPADSRKATVGVCGCGIPDNDANSNGIIDCRSASEARAHYRSIQSLLKSIRPFAPSGNVKKDKKQKRLLSERISKARRLLREVEALVTNPMQAIALSNPTRSITREHRTVSGLVKKALKTSDTKFVKNKKVATAQLTRLISSILA